MARVNDPAEMKAIYDTSRLVYSHELSQSAACRLLKEKTSASEASLKMYFSIFSYMRKGKCYKMGTSAPFTKFLIENIYKDYGYEAVLLALASAKQNSEYRIACGNPQPGIEQVCREIITEHQLQVSFEELNQYYNAGSGTLPTETDSKDIVKENSIYSSTMTGSLKLRIVIGGVSFEAEGDPKTVVAQEKLFAKEILPSALAAVEHIVSFQPKEPARKEPKASSKKNPKAPSKKETTAKKKRTSVDRRGTGKPVTDEKTVNEHGLSVTPGEFLKSNHKDALILLSEKMDFKAKMIPLLYLVMEAKIQNDFSIREVQALIMDTLAEDAPKKKIVDVFERRKEWFKKTKNNPRRYTLLSIAKDYARNVLDG